MYGRGHDQKPRGALKSGVRYRNQQGGFGEIVHTFIDAGKSAKYMKRPELQKMLSSIKRKEVNLVMVTELSRLSRSVRDFVSMNDYFRDHGCKFVSMKDQYDTSTAGGEMVMLTMANLAQFERRQVSERVSANFKARSERGLYNGGQVAYGYKLIANKKGYLAVDDEAAPAVKALFDAFLRERKSFAGQEVGIKEVEDGIWVVSFLDYDLGYFDEEGKRVEPVDDPFGSKVLPMSSE